MHKEDFIATSWTEVEDLMEQAEEFDTSLLSSLASVFIFFVHVLLIIKVTGDKYATIASLAYRQAFAGTKMTWDPYGTGPW